MKRTTVFAIGLLIGFLVGATFGLNIGRDCSLLSNPLQAECQ